MFMCEIEGKRPICHGENNISLFTKSGRDGFAHGILFYDHQNQT
jgi:hypothetical protein